MEKKHIVIHDFSFRLIADFFNGLDRQGPGDESITKQALSFINDLPDTARIADIGCGTGGQTMFLAQHLKGSIIASDIMPEFVETLRTKVRASNLESRIEVREESMDNLSFEDGELDLIWAEGSIYNIGYQKGLNELKKYLKPGGYIAVSEGSWFTDTRPEEIESFWHDNYPEIDTIPKKVEQMQQAGYKLIAHFILPEFCWWNYFNPADDEYMELFLKRHNYNEVAQKLVEHFREETGLYDKYKSYYGYVFYIGQLPK